MKRFNVAALVKENHELLFSRRPSTSFSLSLYILMILPLMAVVLSIGLYHGFWGEEVRLWFESLRNGYPYATEILDFFSDYSDNVLFTFYLLVFLHAVFTKNADYQIFFIRYAIGIAALFFLIEILKGVLGFPRPGILMPADPFSFKWEFESFPSGHTTFIVASALPLAFYFRKIWLYVAMALIITLVGYARLWLGKHHPVDILGGIFFGSLILIYLFKKQHYTENKALAASQNL